MDDTPRKEAVVLFSGGPDSALAAIRVGERFDRVHLLTFHHRGVRGRDTSLEHARRLGVFFQDPDRFVHHVLPTDLLCRRVMYDRYLSNVVRHGFLNLSQSGLCGVSFHWRALIFCLENGIRHVADGAVRTASIHPGQNEAILLRRLKDLYERFGIAYENPVYEEGDRTEQTLYDLRFTRRLKATGSPGNPQTSEQQVLYTMFLRACLPRVSHEEFERRMAVFYQGKIDLVEEWTREFVQKGAASRLAPLIQRE